jgi:hypothetical protein
MAAPRPAERGPAAAFWSDDEVLRLLEAVGLDAALPNNAFGGVKLSATHDAFRDRHALRTYYDLVFPKKAEADRYERYLHFRAQLEGREWVRKADACQSKRDDLRKKYEVGRVAAGTLLIHMPCIIYTVYAVHFHALAFSRRSKTPSN